MLFIPKSVSSKPLALTHLCVLGVIADCKWTLIDVNVAPKRPTARYLGVPDQEISEVLCTLRESSPGLDEVAIHMLKFAGSRAWWQLRILLHQMWTTDLTEWDKLAMEGVAVPLYTGQVIAQAWITADLLHF